VGFPVALKVVSQTVIHKTDIGGVALNVASEAAVGRAVREIVQKVERQKSVLDGILVQKMAPAGRETIVGMTRTPGVGPMVMFGLGGVYVEVLRDVVLRLSPITDADADAMLTSVRSYALLEGVRGEAARDMSALTNALLRVSQLAQRHPRIIELDINPLLSLPQGALALDARVTVVA
jgi:acyl-CoA synthetase (NDP forming)